MPEERVLRWIKDGPLPLCPECGVKVTSYSVGAEDFWTLKPEYQGVQGLPVGPEFGERHVARSFITLEPCKHEMDKLEIVTPPKPPDPLSFIRLDCLYEAHIWCTRCGNRVDGVGYVVLALDELLKASQEHLKTCESK